MRAACRSSRPLHKHPSRGRASLTRAGVPPPGVTTTMSPLFVSTAAAADAFERVDDVVMGGVSSSRVYASEGACDSLVWAGQVRVEGGGFAGCRTRKFTRALDLSSFDGLELRCALTSDDEPERRTWKATLRTLNDRGETVYQAPFSPPAAPSPDAVEVEPIRIPWSEFRLVRGPRPVPDAPPLSADDAAEVFGLGLIVSRFGAAGPMADFRSGVFRLEVGSYGVFARGATTLPVEPIENVVEASADSTNRGNRSPLGWLLSPLLAIVFSESGRRRGRARSLLKDRYGMGELGARLFGQRLKSRRTSALNAFAEGLVELAADAVTTALSLPLRLLFRAAFALSRAAKRLRGEKPLPPMTS